MAAGREITFLAVKDMNVKLAAAKGSQAQRPLLPSPHLQQKRLISVWGKEMFVVIGSADLSPLVVVQALAWLARIIPVLKPPRLQPQLFSIYHLNYWWVSCETHSKIRFGTLPNLMVLQPRM